MRIRLLNLLLLVALGLALSRLWVFLGQPPAALPAVKAEAPPSAATGRPEQPAEIAASGPEAYDVIAARDLFSPTRGVVPPAPAVATQPAARPQPAPKLTLYGVVILDGERTAYLQEGTQEGRPRKVRENEMFSGFLLKAIRPDGVTVVFAGNEIIVPLRTPKEGGEGPAARTQEGAGAAPRPEAPAAFPRRQIPASAQQQRIPAGLQQGQMPSGIQQGQIPAAGRQVLSPPRIGPGMPSVAPPIEPGVEMFGDEEFPEGSLPGGEIPGIPEDQVGE